MLFFLQNVISGFFLGVIGTKGASGALCAILLINKLSKRANIVVYLYLTDVILVKLCILIPAWNKR